MTSRLLLLLLPLLCWPFLGAAEVAQSSPGSGSLYSPSFMSEAQKCGRTIQAQYTPDNQGGRSLCGTAVHTMVTCLARQRGVSGCDGTCGDGKSDGKDYVDCRGGFLKKCGYVKVPPDSAVCWKVGAIISYTKTPTEKGSVFGHVEMVCGPSEYCSIYKTEHRQPWPRPVADGCWVPSSDGRTPDLTKMTNIPKGSYDPQSYNAQPTSPSATNSPYSPGGQTPNSLTNNSTPANDPMSSFANMLKQMTQQKDEPQTAEPAQPKVISVGPAPQVATPALGGPQSGFAPKPLGSPQPEEKGLLKPEGQ